MATSRPEGSGAGFRRAGPVALLCLILAAAVGLVANVDHHLKTARSNRAELREWYCSHLGARCGGPSSQAIEQRWNRREVAYEVSVAALGTVGAASLVVSLRRRVSR